MEKFEFQTDALLGKQIERRFLPLKVAADYLGISQSTLYKKTSGNELRFYKPGKKMIYFEKADLDAFILNGLTPTRAEMAVKAIAKMKGGVNG